TGRRSPRAIAVVSLWRAARRRLRDEGDAAIAAQNWARVAGRDPRDQRAAVWSSGSTGRQVMGALVRRCLDLLAAANTHSRYSRGGRDAAYTRSYRAMRLVVGILGVALPLVFIIGEAFFLRGGVHVRGSISAYYHTPMQDVFVGGLCVIGFLLATYMA